MKRYWLLAGGFWTFVALLFTLQLVYVSRQPNERIDLQAALAVSVAYYLCWIPTTVAVWTFSRDWVPGSMKLSALAARHFVLAVGLVLLHSTASIILTMALTQRMLTANQLATVQVSVHPPVRAPVRTPVSATVLLCIFLVPWMARLPRRISDSTASVIAAMNRSPHNCS